MTVLWDASGLKHLNRQHCKQGTGCPFGAICPNTTKRMLAAFRGVLKECWRLGLMVHDEYARAADIAPVVDNCPLAVGR